MTTVLKADDLAQEFSGHLAGAAIEKGILQLPCQVFLQLEDYKGATKSAKIQGPRGANFHHDRKTQFSAPCRLSSQTYTYCA